MKLACSALALIASLVFTLGAHADVRSITASDLAAWTISIAANASATERYAAEELQRFLQDVCEHSLPIESAPSPSTRAIVLRLAPSPSPSGEDARIRIEPYQIDIEGTGQRGVLYGVYEFAERYLGVRFLTADHTYAPRNPDLRIPCGETHASPAYSFRSCFYSELTGNPAFAARRRINTVPGEPQYGGMTSQPLITHSLFRFVPVAEFGATHPEYFALVDGQRKLDADGGGPQVCSTNPGVIETVTQAVLREVAAQPGLSVVYVSQNDNGDYCECPSCAVVDEREGTHMGAHLTLVNAVAKRIAQAHPSVKVGTLAYWYTRRPPRHLKPEPNVQIQFCAFEKCPFHTVADRSCPRNRDIKRDLNEWLRISSEVYAWDYVFNLNAVDMPFADVHTMGPNLRYYAKRGVRGAFIQGNGRCPGGEFSDLRCYVISALLWNPNRDVDALVDEFLRLHYGPAADAIRTYMDSITGAHGRGAHASILSLAPELGLTAETSKRGLDLFDAALASTTDECIRARIEKVSLPAYKAAIETAGALTYANGRLCVVYPEWMQDRFREYAERCTKVGMDRSAEFASREEYLDDVARNRSGVDAVQLENESWRVTLVPPMNGAVVELFHKPSSRDVLNARGQPGINLRHGVLREAVTEGLDDPGSLDWKSDATSVAILRRLPSGTTVNRTISLDGATLRFATEIAHAATESREYRVEVSAGFRAAGPLSGTKKVKGYAHTDKWRRLPVTSFDADEQDLPEWPDCSGVAWSNSGEHSGASIRYASGQFESPMLFIRPGLAEISTELATPARTLRTGESLRIEYTVTVGPDR